MHFNRLAEIGADLDNSVKIIEIGNIERYIVALVILNIFIVASAGIRIAEAREINDLHSAVQGSIINAFLRYNTHRLVNMRCKNCDLLHVFWGPLSRLKTAPAMHLNSNYKFFL